MTKALKKKNTSEKKRKKKKEPEQFGEMEWKRKQGKRRKQKKKVLVFFRYGNYLILMVYKNRPFLVSTGAQYMEWPASE